MKKNILEVVDLEYTYRNPAGDQKVLKGINAKFEPGKMYAIVGESGSGKTTFLSLLSALDKIQDGDIQNGARRIYGKNENA